MQDGTIGSDLTTQEHRDAGTQSHLPLSSITKGLLLYSISKSGSESLDPF